MSEENDTTFTLTNQPFSKKGDSAPKTAVCPYCGIIFKKPRVDSAYCSNACRCRWDYYNKSRHKKKTPTTPGDCARCGAKFKYARPHQIYCSTGCRENTKGHSQRKCQICGAEFLGRSNAIYCTDQCKKVGAKKRLHINTAIKFQDVICRTCGKKFTPKARYFNGDAPKYCSPQCNKGTRKSKKTATCKGCGSEYVIRNTPLKNVAYCSEQCLKAPKPCAICGKPFHGKGVTKYCSLECRRTGLKNWFDRKKVSARAPLVGFACIECGKITRANPRLKKKYCSKQCLAKVGKRNRRARVKSAFVEEVHLNELIIRDHGTCKICCIIVDVSAAVPDPMAPTIDHIVSLINGGEHSYENCQLAHYKCNVIKGVR